MKNGLIFILAWILSSAALANTPGLIRLDDTSPAAIDYSRAQELAYFELEEVAALFGHAAESLRVFGDQEKVDPLFMSRVYRQWHESMSEAAALSAKDLRIRKIAFRWRGKVAQLLLPTKASSNHWLNLNTEDVAQRLELLHEEMNIHLEPLRLEKKFQPSKAERHVRVAKAIADLTLEWNELSRRQAMKRSQLAFRSSAGANIISTEHRLALIDKMYQHVGRELQSAMLQPGFQSARSLAAEWWKERPQQMRALSSVPQSQRQRLHEEQGKVTAKTQFQLGQMLVLVSAAKTSAKGVQ